MSTTLSAIFADFEGDAFNNTDDLWCGKFIDLNADGIYKLYATDETGNQELNDLMTAELPANLLGYHLHFYTFGKDAPAGLNSSHQFLRYVCFDSYIMQELLLY